MRTPTGSSGAEAVIGAVADRLRAGVLRSLAAAPEGERRAVLAGVVLGEDGGLEKDLRDSFRASGLYHLLAVSGQNVAYVVAGAILLAWTLGLPRRAGEAGALCAIAAYVLAVGWQPSVVRAGVAGALASLAWLASRPRDRWYFLLTGAAVLLAWNPYGLLDPGFQLSFAAVASIFLLVPRIERALDGYPVPRWLTGGLAVSLACGIATAPILLVDFGAIPLYSILANALAAPVVAPLLGLALAAATLHPFLPEAAAAIAWADGWLAAYLAFCARTVGGLPHAQATSAAAVGLVGGALAVGAFVARARGPGLRRTAVAVGVALALVVAWRSVPSGPAPPPTGLRLTVLDVGQGDAILLQVPEGAVLVDEGPPEADVADQLDGLGVDRLAALVLTHPERDHVGGAADVLERIPVEAVVDPRIPADSEDEARALAAARERGVPVRTARAGSEYRIGALRLRVLWPAGDPLPGGNPNDSAVVLLVSYGTVDALLTADAEGAVTVPIRPPPVEILKVAHHGSDDPRLRDLLELLRPRIAVVSVGERERLRPSDTGDDGRARRRSGPGGVPHRRGRARDDRDRRREDLRARGLTMLAPVPDDELDPIYLLTGSDRPKILRALERLRARFGTESIESLSAESTGGEDAVAACNSLGLFAGGGGRLVVVDGVERWKKADEEAVASYVADPVPGAVLALVAGGDLKSSALPALCAKAGTVLAFDVPRPKDLPTWVRAQFERLGVQADADASRALVEIVGEDATALASEVEKLAAWSGGEAVGRREVELVAAPAHEASAWAIMDAWGARDLPGALAACQAELEKGADPFVVAMRLASQVGLVRQSQALAEEGLGARDIAKRLKKHEYRVRRALGHAENYSRDELDDAVIRLAELDAALKGSSRLAGELELERALVELVRRPELAARRSS